MRTLIKLLVAGVMIAALGGAVIIATPQDDADQARAAALRAFEERIGEYAALHRRLEEPLPPLKPYTSPRAVLLRRTYLRTAIKTARPNARQGDIFAPPVARLFRDLITNALAGRDAEAMLRDLFEEQPTLYAFHPRVYEQYPDWATHEMPLILLLRLPVLPEDIEYRLVDHDLVLWDIDADLIVDVLPGAVSRPTT
jgi:hypothetical protein